MTPAQTTIRNLHKVLDVNAKINSTLDLDPLLDILMTTAAEVMQSKAASLMLIDQATNELVFKVALGSKGSNLKENFRIKMGEGIAGTVAETGKSMIVNDTAEDKRFAKRFDLGTGFNTEAILCVPMNAKGKRIGVLEAINPIGRPHFNDEDLKLFEIFADQAATAIENARLHSETIKQEKTKQELKIAHEIQQNFLPDLTSSRFPIDIAAKSIPARDVGGDFYDCIMLDEFRIGIIIGDVSGKGVPAALYMVRAITEYRFMAPHAKNAADLLKHLNGVLARGSSFGMFVTLLYMIFDTKKMTLEFSSAGHHPILRKKNGRTEELENPGGLPVGMMEGSEYIEKTIAVERGDSFFAYTDGIVEARNKSKNEYSIDRLKEILQAPATSAKQFAERILQDLEKFTAGCEPHDDITSLTVVIP